ncbi:MAG: hypothetical protein ILO36_03350, partial [Abditibacteriota bacterium]|nr:hypothetical protein [Abditibacteriota bacterium]
MDFTAGDFAERFGLELIGDGNAPIKGIAYVQDAKEGDLVLADSRKYFSEALLTPASCIVCDSAYSVPEDKTLLVSPRAGSIFLDILESLCPEPYVPSPGAPPVSPACSVGEGCVIAPGAHIGPGSVLGDRVTVYPGVFIGADVTIGPDTIIYSNVSIYDRTEIGASCILHSGCVLGADGFG